MDIELEVHQLKLTQRENKVQYFRATPSVIADEEVIIEVMTNDFILNLCSSV